MISRSLQWRKWIARCPTCGLYLVALLAACFSLMRAVAVFGPPQLQVLLPLSFTLMAITPWIVLSRFGRDQIGLRRARSISSYAKAVFAGVLLALVCGVMGSLLFEVGEQNWFVTIARNFGRSFDTGGKSTFLLFAGFTECSVFAIVHLCHHGLYRTSMGFSFWMPSSIIWAALMFLAGYLFAYFRNTSDSIFPAVVCHMAFNATMGVYIFSVLWGAHHAA